MRVKILSGLAAAAVLASCGQARSEDGGPAVERSFAVGDFDRIELAGAYDVTVHTGAKPGVKARGGENALDRLVVEVRNGVLVIEPRKGHGFNWNWSRNGKVAIDVTVPSLRGAELSGAGDINIDNVKGDRFDGGVNGAGDLTIERVEVGTLALGINGAGSATVRGGSAKSASFEVAGAGDIDAKGVASETASVTIAGAGGARINAAKTAAVNVMGAGDVDVTGGAKCTVSKAGIGNVRCS
jgi:hypothetical protein